MKKINDKRAARTWRKKKRRIIGISLKRHDPYGSRAKRKKPISRRFVLALIGALIVAAAAYAACFSPALRIKEILVTGTENIDGTALENTVRSEMAGKKYGFIPGDNFLVQDQEGIEGKIKEQFTEADSVNVSLRFPDKMAIEIKEKNTALIWCRDACYFVNEKGVAFLLADESELLGEEKHFLKIVEETEIAEETDEERRAMADESGENMLSTDREDAGETEAGDEVSETQDAQAVLLQSLSVLPAISLNSQVADESFISFAVEIDRLLGRNAKIKLKYFKTKGYKTRELIGFTDQNIRLYFDTTKSAERQAKNLDYFLSEAMEKEQIGALRYIYLKNEDRVFYR